MQTESHSVDLPVYSNLGFYIREIENFPAVRREGRVMQVIGNMVEATNPGCSVGGMCLIYNSELRSTVAAEVVGFRQDRMLVMPLNNAHGIGPNAGLFQKSVLQWYQWEMVC